MTQSFETISENRSFGGTQGVYRHKSQATGTDMTFAVYLPEAAQHGRVPVLWYLSGLTCTHENAMTKAAAQEWCAETGLAIIFPDTSPRGDDVADDEAYDLGKGAGFYVNATQDPWKPHYQMWQYIVHELPELVSDNFAIDREAMGISGHSMGGHGALTIAMTHPERYRSVSAFSPIANPTESDWGRKQLGAYLGDDREAWKAHDSTLLMRERGYPGEILIDQGSSDQFLDLLKPEALAHAMMERRQPGQFRMQPGYDHSYFFVQSFMGDHVMWHAERLA
ncbi:S-formylglutathione hydrolase [Paracoccus alcaliphilus]|uniref:S-formylglutathione hydrolase n=1 Tax=Paracoccus alcaliphilus TaxID=34002 RepID=A0A1H8GSF1_9RHOB|nr:S-formylglutathione hydrolase [Paracoccus alcaliphilus]WCR18794.1 S-formylglutathione hydrolase [Paracoccus alcaliphilus]SEN46427.1 S-formylglutathione hydrolase [Paracoccus alcaliphilus]